VTTPYYADDLATLHLGDCLDLAPELAPRSVDAVLTDPPFSSGGRRENARSLRKSMNRGMSDDDWIAGDAMSTGGFVWMMRAIAARIRPSLKPGAHFLAFIDWRMHGNLAGALESADLRQHPTLVWDKTHFGMGAVFRNQHEWIVHFSNGSPADPARRDMGNVLRCPPVRDGFHPTEKPVGLLGSLLSVVVPAGGLVVDPFAGSGSTLVAAKMLGRRSVGYELDERFAEKAAKRLQAEALPFHETDQPAPPLVDLFGDAS
jgi:site-specific DNA-methyltransferase (adenine-specific)